MILLDLFALLNLLIGTLRHDMTQSLHGINIGVQYIRYKSEYILNLQIHQHSLLTRKVFSRQNSSAQVFVIGSSLDHHQSWIITGSSSSLLSLSRSNGAISQLFSP